ncbi:putative dithiobiotin synthetase [Salmonella enterica subsp. enterica serovar Typhi]|nr:putative dithiobiotin synthetase [Salmonella enterica subsp. enterica serovar Typhi]
MLKRFFITGTDTSVGKTVVSRALLQALSSGGKSVAGYKPVAKGSKETPEGMRNKDALVLQSVSSLELPYEAINPIALSEEESSVAHSCPINYTLLSNGLASLSDKVDHVVVEGTGGWRSLMNDLRPLSEWVVQEQLPVLMVVGIQEGCINHALLTAQAVANDGLPLIGWVANRIIRLLTPRLSSSFMARCVSLILDSVISLMRKPGAAPIGATVRRPVAYRIR